MADPSVTAWRCTVCGYVHRDARPPFAPTAGRTARRSNRTRTKPAVRQASPESPIALISREDDLPCFRLDLTRILAGGVSVEDLMIHPRAWYGEQGIDLLLGVEVIGLSLPDRTVSLRDGGVVPFE